MDIHFEYLNVVQFGSERDIDDIIVSTPLVQKDNKSAKKPVFYPSPNANAITLATLIKETDLSIDDVINKGAIIKMVFNYECDLGHDECSPHVAFERLSHANDMPV